VRLSARGLHALALRAFRIGNRGRLSFCEALRVLGETRLYLDLGYSSLAAYAGAFFQLRRAEAFEYVRVARALGELGELREAFGQGRLGWSTLKAITRVASVASQAGWIEFAAEHGVERTLAEARDALRRGRDVPRDGSYGLPNLDQKLVLRFSRSDMDRVRAWIESACAEVAERTGAGEVTLEQAILFLCEKQRVPATVGGVRSAGDDDPATDDVAGRRGTDGCRVSCRARIVYQRCPDCRRARVGTRDGFVEVGSEELERHEGCAEPVAIDGPTPARLRRRILAREAGRCGNPRCHHLADHCHHIVFRSRGGKSELENEVAVCTTCHALIHAGLLRVVGRADGALRWSPVAPGDSLERAVGSERAAAERLPVLQIVPESANRQGATCGPRESAAADSVKGRRRTRSAADGSVRPGRAASAEVAADHGLNLGDLAQGLMRLGLTADRSMRMIETAVAALPRGEVTEASVLRRAVAAI